MTTVKRRSTRNKKVVYRDGRELKCLSTSSFILDVCKTSLLDPTVEIQLPAQLHEIYQSMMHDLSFINNIQTEKDISFSHCNLTFWNGEDMIRRKRKAYFECRIEEDVVNGKIAQEEKKEKQEVDNKPRPNRKRKAPVKFDEISPEKVVVEAAEFIDLSCDESAVNPTAKIYFREPSQRRVNTVNSGKLKEHTLLDKIMLGINCVRQWTDKGLHLTKIGENDLGMLNKRLASVKCSMTDLAEHTDENNNKYLSVLIQSSMFTVPRVSGSSCSVSGGTTPPATVTNTIVAASPTRHKNKPHITAMYRHRHYTPSILARPTLTSQHRPADSHEHSLPRFSAVKAEEHTKVQPALNTDQSSPITDPSMTASRLLKLKSQVTTITPLKPLVTADPTKQSAQFPNITTINGVISPLSTVIYQTIPRNNFVLPLFLTPQRTIVNVPQRTFRIPLSQSTAANPPRFHNSNINHVTRYQQAVPMRNISLHQSQISQHDNTQTGSQSTILKNLLLQSNHHSAAPNGRVNLTSSHMVPLSVFQSNRHKWQIGSMSQVHLKK